MEGADDELLVGGGRDDHRSIHQSESLHGEPVPHLAGGDVADCELKLKFRLENNKGNSGIQFRSFIAEDGMGVGYQADILPGGSWCGAICDEYTDRETLMVPNGHKTVVEKDGKRVCTPAGRP